MKPRFRPRSQMHRYHRLGHPVCDRWHTKQTDPAAMRWGSPPPVPEAESKTPNSADSKRGTGCSSDQPRTPPRPAHPRPGHPCSPQPACTLPRPSAWECRTACPAALACSSSLPPRATAPVDRIDIPDEPAPSLHAHPSEQALHGYYEPVRQRTPHRYSVPSVSASARSLSRPRANDPPVAVSALAFSRSVQEPQTRITPPLRRTPLGQYTGTRQAQFSRKEPGPRFRCHLRFSTLQRRRPSRTSQAERFWDVFPVPTWRDQAAPFPCRSPRRSSANAAQGGLAPAPAGRRRRANHPPSLAQHRLRKGSPTRFLLQRS